MDICSDAYKKESWEKIAGAVGSLGSICPSMSEKTKTAILKAHEVKRENKFFQTSKPELSQSSNSPMDQILFLQRTIGNQEVQRLFKSGIIQAKLKISQPNDIFEQEADQFAEKVMRMPEPGIQMKPTWLFAEGPSCGDEEVVQTKPLKITPMIQLKETKQKSYEFSKEPYEAKEFELSFSDEEKRWIKEVFALPEIALIVSSYKDLPDVELHRVSKIKSGANGETRGEKIAISSKLYTKKTFYPKAKGKTSEMVPPTKKEMFKETLIHELVHFFEKYTRGLEEKEKIVVPSTLVNALVYPEETGFKLSRYAFGWFVHPRSNFIFHFDLPCVLSFTDPKCNILGESDLFKIRKEKKYEPSPMPESGDRIGPEEDIAESISLYLTSANSRKLLETKYPLRYKLIEWYFKNLEGKKVVKKGK